MAIELITGHAGTAHISSADDGAFNAGTIGAGRYVLTTANEMAATMPSANIVTIATGDALFDGRHVRITSAESVTIDSGTQGQTRHDIVGIAYADSSGVESAAIQVFKGTPSASGAVDPDLPTGNILEGAASAFMPLYRITLDGINADDPEALFETMNPADSRLDSIGAQLTADETRLSAVEAKSTTNANNITRATKVYSYTHNIISILGSTTIPLVLRRVGNFVTATVGAQGITPARSQQVLDCGTIPSGYRPATTAMQSGLGVVGGNISTVGLYRWCITTGGAVQFISSDTDLRERPLCLTYYTSNAFPS